MPAPSTRTLSIAAARRTFVVDSDNASIAFVRAPESVLDFAFDWATNYLASPLDTLASYTLEVAAREVQDDDPVPPVELTIGTPSQAAGVVTFWITAGNILGSVVRVWCEIVTTGGRTDRRSIYIETSET